MELESHIGTVIAVCKSPEHGFPTYPQDMVAVGMLGIDDDAHSGELRESFTNPGTLKANDRPISIVSEEIRVWVNGELGLNIKHGDFNEQIVVSGLGDLGNIPVGAHILFANGVMLKVTDRAYPCKRLEDHNGKGLIKALAHKTESGIYSKRGILCEVVEEGQITPGEKITIIV